MCCSSIITHHYCCSECTVSTWDWIAIGLDGTPECSVGALYWIFRDFKKKKQKCKIFDMLFD